MPKYAIKIYKNMQIYADICRWKYARICTYIHKIANICNEYANIAYANICNEYAVMCIMYKYMQSKTYAKKCKKNAAEICR